MIAHVTNITVYALAICGHPTEGVPGKCEHIILTVSNINIRVVGPRIRVRSFKFMYYYNSLDALL